MVGVEIAKKLKLHLDTLAVRKLGAPFQPELGIGAIAPGGIRVLDKETVARLGIRPKELLEITRKERQELKRRMNLYSGKMGSRFKGKTIVLVDDGLATGISAIAAIEYLKSKQVSKIILAVPVCSEDIYQELSRRVDRLICLEKPLFLRSVGNWYKNFSQVTDQEVLDLIRQNLISQNEERY